MGVLYSLAVGGSALRPVSTVSVGLGVISCVSPTDCTVAALDQHNGTPGIISFTGGKPGKVQLFPRLESVIADPFAGFSGVVRTSARKFIALGPSAAGGTDVVIGKVSSGRACGATVLRGRAGSWSLSNEPFFPK
jgi:hypothetical protein